MPTEEKRQDPETGIVYSWDDFLRRFGNEYHSNTCKKYWNENMIVAETNELELSSCWLQVTSPLEGSMVKMHRPTQGVHEGWSGHCPCCKRPLQSRLRSAPSEHAKTPVPPEVRGRYAYVITLWGSAKGYVLGALILGHSIRQTGTPHSLVCLYTDEVPQHMVDLLSHVWDCRRIEHVEVVTSSLAWPVKASRFERVFTKLRALGLVEFEKILMMDIDLLVVANVDELFALPAPAAMQRGVRDGPWLCALGEPLDGSSFFAGRGPDKVTSWGQGTGINAGVMLWQPSLQVLDDMLKELQEHYHPGHIRGNGPEQDYLSRYWADAPWHHISVEYNYQVHHMFNALDPEAVFDAERVRLLEDCDKIKIIHYSGEEMAKPWHRALDPTYLERGLWPSRDSDDAFLQHFAQGYEGYKLWVLKDREAWAFVQRQPKWWGDMRTGFALGEDGVIYSFAIPPEAAGEVAPEVPQEGLVPAQIPEAAVKGAMHMLRKSLDAWYDAFSSCEEHLGFDIVSQLSAGDTPSSASTASGSAVWSGGGSLPGSAASTAGTSGVAARVKVGSGGLCIVPEITWGRNGGWLTEQPFYEGRQRGALTQASVYCCGARGGELVQVSVRGQAELRCAATAQDGQMDGIHAKVGSEALVFLPVRANQPDDMDAVRSWVQAVPAGELAFVCLMGLDEPLLQPVLAILAQLGVPGGPLGTGLKVLATAGVTKTGSTWTQAHAGPHTAFASLLLEEYPAAE